MSFSLFIYPFLFVALYFEVFLLLSFVVGKRRYQEPAAADRASLPSVTIFVPCYNEEKTVGKTLESLLALDYPKDKLSIFAINDGSKDDTRATVESYARLGAPRVRYLHQENAGANRARNRAIAAAGGEILLIINDDTIAAPGMVREHPVNGVGVRRFRDAFAACDPSPGQPAEWGDGPALHAHQIVLEILSETGILGLILWLAGAAQAAGQAEAADGHEGSGEGPHVGPVARAAQPCPRERTVDAGDTAG